MRKKWKGYFTIEASFIMPIILLLYIMIILAALYLYCRCAISQDNFLLGMRAGNFTWGENNYGEVIYGENGRFFWRAEDYVGERLVYKRAFYPFFPTEGGECTVNRESVQVKTEQKSAKAPVTKNVQRLNPVEVIREERRN